MARKLFDGKNEKEVVQKLEYVWSIWWTDTEASFYAGISKSALSDYLKRNPTVSEQKTLLLSKQILRAREEVIKWIWWNPDFALKYLERKQASEFSPRHIALENKDKDLFWDINLIMHKCSCWLKNR